MKIEYAAIAIFVVLALWMLTQKEEKFSQFYYMPRRSPNGLVRVPFIQEKNDII